MGDIAGAHRTYQGDRERYSGDRGEQRRIADADRGRPEVSLFHTSCVDLAISRAALNYRIGNRLAAARPGAPPFGFFFGFRSFALTETFLAGALLADFFAGIDRRE